MPSVAPVNEREKFTDGQAAAGLAAAAPAATGFVHALAGLIMLQWLHYKLRMRLYMLHPHSSEHSRFQLQLNSIAKD